MPVGSGALAPRPVLRAWPSGCALLALASACTCGGGDALPVTVEIDPRAATTVCVKVVARPAGGGPEVATAPISRPADKDALDVAIYQGSLPDAVEVLARGYDDSLCARPNEESAPAAARFAPGPIQPVTVRLLGSPCVGADSGTPCAGGVCRSDQACVDAGTEIDCGNGVDDDGDGRADCLDADCLAVACAAGGGQCTTKPTCQPDGGCPAAAPRTGLPCDAGVCLAGGACATFPYAPSNFDPRAIAARGMAGTIALSCNAWIDSSDGGLGWCIGQPSPVLTVITQDAGPEAMVVAMSGLTVSGSLTLTGSRPVILAVWGDTVVSGTITARSGAGIDGGAGFNPAGPCDAEDGAVDGTTTGGGGGGGSHGERGEDGGNGDLPGHGGRPGSLSGSPELVPLRGGCSGGNGGRSTAPAGAGHGGAGGGAFQLSAAGSLTLTGTVIASGQGGGGGVASGGGGNGGGGGGSGGAMLLEAWDVFIPGGARLAANGGGGGEGSNLSSTSGSPGGDGTGTASPAAGSADVTPCGGNGGQGGAAAGAAQPGANSTSSCGGGGGGGGVGRIRINGPGGCQVDAGVQSPRPSFSGSCP
ncbi:MAG TPA: hypothetical protein VND93_03830 [Myxococcales bacterium]|jgi:hypothetical protein|nr:hypothetical protein [Myxococcales bacterium]